MQSKLLVTILALAVTIAMLSTVSGTRRVKTIVCEQGEGSCEDCCENKGFRFSHLERYDPNTLGTRGPYKEINKCHCANTYF